MTTACDISTNIRLYVDFNILLLNSEIEHYMFKHNKHEEEKEKKKKKEKQKHTNILNAMIRKKQMKEMS